jgi:hypothetical protein
MCGALSQATGYGHGEQVNAQRSFKRAVRSRARQRTWSGMHRHSPTQCWDNVSLFDSEVLGENTLCCLSICCCQPGAPNGAVNFSRQQPSTSYLFSGRIQVVKGTGAGVETPEISFGLIRCRAVEGAQSEVLPAR